MSNTANPVDRIALTAAVVIYLAGLCLVAVLLPARYGRDPLGTGHWLGIAAAASAEDVGPVEAPAATPLAASAANTPESALFRSDRRTFVLEPSKGVEFKYGIARGRAMIYSWVATSPVHYDFHGEPEGARVGYADTYEKADAASAGHGTFVAPTTGIHGWYWENRGTVPATLTLDVVGFFTTGIEFLPAGPIVHEIPAP
jgi:hypothetical protein